MTQTKYISDNFRSRKTHLDSITQDSPIMVEGISLSPKCKGSTLALENHTCIGVLDSNTW